MRNIHHKRSAARANKFDQTTKTSVKDKAVAAKKLEQAVLGKEKIGQDASAKGVLMECKGVQLFECL